MGDADDRVEQLEARLAQLESKQEKTHDLLLTSLAEINEMFKASSGGRPTVIVDTDSVSRRLESINGQLAEIANRLR